MRVVDTQFPKGTCKIEHVIAIRATRSTTAPDLLGHDFESRVAKEGDIVGGSVVGHARHIALLHVNGQFDSHVAVLLSVIEMFEHVMFDKERFAVTRLTGGLDESNDAARFLLRAAVIVGSLPESARPAVDTRRLRFNVREVLLED